MVSKVIVSNPESFDKIKKIFSETSKNNIHVIADFDRTLTFGGLDGKRNPSLIALIRDG